MSRNPTDPTLLADTNPVTGRGSGGSVDVPSFGDPGSSPGHVGTDYLTGNGQPAILGHSTSPSSETLNPHALLITQVSGLKTSLLPIMTGPIEPGLL